MLSTEDTSLHGKDMDLWPSGDLLAAIWAGQRDAINALEPALGAIGRAVDAAVPRLKGSKGRIAYCGAGTSGLLAMQDGMELTPTFGWPLERIVFLMAGGDPARLLPLGHCEDDREAAAQDAERTAFAKDDILIAVAASGSTPYTLECLERAGEAGALTIAITNTPDTPLARAADMAIEIMTGAEVIAGSTRMAAGTAQKAALTSLSTLLMTRLGFVVDGRMVNLVVDNEKLRTRATRIVADLAGTDDKGARVALDKANGAVKAAILVARGCDPERASRLLATNQDDLRQALAEV